MANKPEAAGGRGKQRQRLRDQQAERPRPSATRKGKA